MTGWRKVIATDLEGDKVAVGTSAVEITFSGTTQAIVVRADKNNTGLLFVGKSNVDSSGNNAITFLKKSDAITIDYRDASNAYFIVSDTVAQNFWKGTLL